MVRRTIDRERNNFSFPYASYLRASSYTHLLYGSNRAQQLVRSRFLWDADELMSYLLAAVEMCERRINQFCCAADAAASSQTNGKDGRVCIIGVHVKCE